jgi:hypothetical protein
MDPKLLLVKIVTLLYKESQLQEPTGQSGELVKNAISTIKLSESSGEFDRGREVIQAIRSTALWMADNPADYSYDRTALLQRIRVNVGDEDSLYQALEAGLGESDERTDLKKQTILLRGELRNAIDVVRVKEAVKKIYQQSHFNLDGFDVKALVRDALMQLEPFTLGMEGQRIEGMLEEINLNDLDDSADLMRRAQDEMSNEGILKTGWQCLNRMTGDHDGLRRGETVVVGALQHNYKTGFTLTVFKQLALYNKPYMRDPTKKPLLLHISLENELKMNMLWLYRNMIENETKQPCVLAEVDHAEAARYVHERLTATGYEIRMCRMNPSETSFQSYFDLILQLEAEGYEVHGVVCDYLNMMSKKGCALGPAGFEIRDLWRRMRNFNAPKGILFISPHQLSPAAKQLVRNQVEDFVKEIANKGYYDGCTTVDQEVDLEIYIHIVKLAGESYLTIQRGKHRKVVSTPERFLYTVLPFSQVGDIQDDYGQKDISLKQAGGVGPGGSQAAWFQ